jgi:hypothetical protein
MAATTNESVTAGPAACPAAAAVLTNKPAPMMAPIPNAIKFAGPNVLFKPFSESSACDKSAESDFFLNKLIQLV